MMKTEYQLALERWVRGLSDSQLALYMEGLESFGDAEVDALIKEDIRRILMVTI